MIDDSAPDASCAGSRKPADDTTARPVRADGSMQRMRADLARKGRELMRGWLTVGSIAWFVALQLILPLQAQPSSNIEIVPALTHSSEVNWSAVSKDGALALTGASDSTVKLWDVRTGRLIRTFRGAGGLVMHAAFMPDGKHIVSAGANGTTIDIWEIETGKLLHSLNDQSGPVFMGVPSPDGALVLTASSDNTVKLWDWAAEKSVRKFTGHRNIVFAAAFSPDGKRLVTGSKDGTIKLWNVATAALVRNLNAAGWVYAVAFSPDGKYILSGAERGAQLWNAQSGALLYTMSGHSRVVCSVAFFRMTDLVSSRLTRITRFASGIGLLGGC